MRIRLAFCSNSSSSSFILGFKNDLDEALDNVLNINVSENNLLESIIKELVQEVKDSVHRDIIYESLEGYLKDIECDDIEKIDDYGYDTKRIVDLLNNGFKVVRGGFVDECNELSSFLCNQDFDFKTDEFVFWQSGGY